MVDASNNSFVIAPTGHDYYINDGSTAGDIFTTAIGNDGNSGKSTDKPMRSLQALLDAYDLGAGDIIHVDSGAYTLSGSVTLNTDDTGVTIQGPDFAAGGTPLVTFNRNNANASVFYMNGADNVTIERVNITGGSVGVLASYNSNFPTAISDNITIRRDVIYGNTYGIQFSFAGSGSIIDSNVIRNNGNRAIDTLYGTYDTSSLVVANNIVRDDTFGVYLVGANATVTGNQFYNLGAQNGVGVGIFSANSLVSGNDIHNNAGPQLSVGGAGQIVENNTVYNGTGDGISATGSTVRNNVVYGNAGTGINAYTGSVVSGNRVYGNGGVGVIVSDNSSATGNRIYSNSGGGLTLSTWIASATNNLIYANSNFGVTVTNYTYAYGGGREYLTNNTIYQLTGDAIRFNSNALVTIENNVVVAGGAFAFNLAGGDQVNLVIDYNVVRLLAAAKFGQNNGVNYNARADWFYETGLDRHTTVADPQFIDVDGADNLLGYTSATGDHGVDDNFLLATTSPTIDLGDPTSPFANEPSPNGGRVNLGYTGNTAQALPSPTALIQVVAPSGLEKIQTGQQVTITWRTAGIAAGRERENRTPQRRRRARHHDRRQHAELGFAALDGSEFPVRRAISNPRYLAGWNESCRHQRRSISRSRMRDTTTTSTMARPRSTASRQPSATTRTAARAHPRRCDRSQRFSLRTTSGPATSSMSTPARTRSRTTSCCWPTTAASASKARKAVRALPRSIVVPRRTARRSSTSAALTM